MTNSAIGRTIATIAFTLLFSSAAIMSAVGPAQASPTTVRVA